MAIYTNTFEGGTNGATMTVANSGGMSGQAFDSVTANITYTTGAMHGSLAATTSTASNQYGRWSFAGETVLLRSYHKFSSVADGATPIRVNLSSGSVFASVMNGANAGRVQLYMGSGQATSPAGQLLSAGTWYRFELYVKPGTGDGALRLAVYEGDSTVAWWDSGDVTGLTIASPATELYGKIDNNAVQVTWDSVGIKTGSDAVWGAWPASSSPAPTLTVTRPAANLADLRTSTSGDASSLTYNTPVWVSGPVLTVSSLASGLWLFSQDTSTAAVYTVRITQGDSQTASQNITVAAQASSGSGTNVAAPRRLISAPPSANWG